MHTFWKIIAGIFGGFIVAFFASNIADLVSSKETGAAILLLSWAASIFVAAKSKRAARAWHWLLILSGCLCFVIPLATFVSAAHKESGVEVVGGIVAAGIFGVVFFLFGLALLVVGLLIGRNPKVIVVQRNDAKT